MRRRILNDYLWVGIPAALLLGLLLRVDQIGSQVLIEDEWHPVHQVIYYNFRHVLGTFGNADYSIPLTAFYYGVAESLGLSEFALRLPQLLVGVATVALVPLMLRRRFEDRVLMVLAFLLAVSPFLVSYSRMARSYAITLLGVFVALWLLDRALKAGPIRWKPAAGYALACGLVAWAHPIVGPILVAPLVARTLLKLCGREALPWRSLFALGAMTGASLAAFILPPLLHDPAALSGKSGMDRIGLDTIVGAWHLWMGTGSPWVAGIALALAAAGLPTAFARSRLVRWILLGTLLTIAALVVTRPWWINQPLALGRYLLPVVPILLLAMAISLVRVGDFVVRSFGYVRMRHPPAGVLALPVLLVFWWPTSPHPEVLVEPNSYTQHSAFQFDYREERNPVRARNHEFPGTAFWDLLASHPPGSVTVAVAPFRYASYEWPAPQWERISHQRVIPAYLWGTCESTRHGEVPDDERFSFDNAVHVRDTASLRDKGVSYLAYYKAPPRPGESAALPKCEAWVREHFGPPAFEDDVLAIWTVR